jgi:tRNA(fMet)-specific endonuclease VapC
VIAAKLIADTNVVSYLFENDELGFDYRYLMGGQPTGVTPLSVEEVQYGAAIARWGDSRRRALHAFMHAFILLPTPVPVAEICGNLRAERSRVGRPIELADAWVAATGLWYGVPVVTHDRDLERIPGLEVLTLLDGWQARQVLPAYGGLAR